MLLGTQNQDFFPTDIGKKLKYVKAMGFSCFEIDGRLLVDNLEVVKSAINSQKLPVVSACGGYRGWIGDFSEDKRKTAILDIKQIITALNYIGGRNLVLPAAWGMFTYRLPPHISPRSKELDIEVLVDSLGQLDDFAKKNNVTLCLEPLNRYQDHMLNTLEDAKNIITIGKLRSVKITADFYHMNIEEDDISRALEEHANFLGHVHIADNHRYQPGTGSIDFKKHLKTLVDIDYDGAIIYEGRIRGENPEQEYTKSVSYIKSQNEALQ
jgi:sugar phosphate isomerase/epimerase